MNMCVAKRGFTLVELLVVLAIMAIMAAASLPAISSLMSSYNLTSATDTAIGMIAFGRQEAIALDEPVEVRFYQYQIPGFVHDTGSGSFHAYQLLKDTALPSGLSNSGTGATAAAVPLGRVQFLPQRLIFSNSSSLSPLLTAGSSSPGPSPPPAGLPSSYTYKSFIFRPDGSTNLSTGNNFVTLIDGSSTALPPSNYATILIDRVSGAAKVLRPGG
jgi:uncharacterized protein (TIGR02596 family)